MDEPMLWFKCCWLYFSVLQECSHPAQWGPLVPFCIPPPHPPSLTFCIAFTLDERVNEREREREKVRLDGAWRSLIKSPNLALRLQLHTHTHTRSRLSLLTPASFPISPPNRDKWTRGLWLIHFCQGLYSTMPSGRSGRHGLQHVHDTHSLMQTLQRAPKTLP